MQNDVGLTEADQQEYRDAVAQRARATQVLIAELTAGVRQDIEVMEHDDKVTELLWIARQLQDAIGEAAKNPMVKMALGI